MAKRAADSYGADGVHFFPAGTFLNSFTFASISSPGLKRTTFLAGTITFSPVRGLRAFLGFRCLTHREPKIVESSKDKKRVLANFSAIGPFGEFGGSCLYAERDGSWDAYTLRPSESGSIAKAVAWLVKRKWEAW